jgi:hypothetical protein
MSSCRPRSFKRFCRYSTKQDANNGILAIMRVFSLYTIERASPIYILLSVYIKLNDRYFFSVQARAQTRVAAP